MNTPEVIPAADAMNPWSEPQDIGPPLPPSLDLLACIPDSLATLRDFTHAVSTAYQVAPEAIFPQILGIASGCLGGSIETRIRPQWVETAPLWFAVLQESGEKKTSVLSCLADPVRAWQRRESERLSAAVAEREERRRDLEEQQKCVRTQLGRNPADAELEATRRDLTQRIREMPPLKPSRILLDDMTPEAMREVLSQNGEKALWITSEIDAAGLLGTRHAKQGGPNIDLLLKCKSGEPFQTDRASGKAIDLARPCVALVFSVQPIALRDVLADPYAAGRGLVPRFSVISPLSWIGSRHGEPPPIPPAFVEWWTARVREMLAMPWTGKVLLDGGVLRRHEGAPRILELDSEAYEIHRETREMLEHRQGPSGDLYSVRSYAGKLAGEVARVAAVFALLADPSAQRIGADAMRAAVAAGLWMLAHTRHVLGDAGLSDDERDARRLLDHLRRGGRRAFSERDAKRALEHRGQDAPAALTVLDDMGWTRLASPRPPPAGKNRGGRPPGPIREVNPKLFDG
jgi:hypothetical protein